MKIFKEQIKVDYDDNDKELLLYLESSLDHTLRTLNREITDILEEGGGELPKSFLQGVLIFARHLWETGGTMVSSSMQPNPYGYWALVSQFYREK